MQSVWLKITHVLVNTTIIVKIDKSEGRNAIGLICEGIRITSGECCLSFEKKVTLTTTLNEKHCIY